jgi:2-methylcitrate dehydratase PrpD
VEQQDSTAVAEAPAGNAPARRHLVACATPTAALAQFASGVDVASLTPAERTGAKRHLLDTIGAAICGIDQPVVRAATALLEEITSGGGVPIVGSSRRMDLQSAAYLTAVSCHALEADDGNREGSIHPGTAVVPAILAAGYHLDADGASTLAAVVGGYEVAVSLAEVLHPHASRRGFQTTGVVGLVGAAAAVGRLLALDAVTLERALGIAAASSSGIFSYLTGGGNVKKLHPGHAAREGVLAALIAQRGVVEGPLGVAETQAGIFQAFGGLPPWTGAAFDHRRGALAITRSYLKPYPCCRHIHPAIDALLQLRAAHGIDPDRVARIDVGTYEAAMPHAALPFDSLTVAQLSFPYVMAAALRTGAIELATFGDAMRADPRIVADTRKVSVVPDPECCASYPKQGPARVTITMSDGATHTCYVAQPGGAPEKPLSDEDLFAKFRMMVSARLSAAAADAVIEDVWTIERSPRVRTLIDRLTVGA